MAPTHRPSGSMALPLPVSDPADHVAQCERLVRATREAGERARRFIGGPLKQWTKGEGDSPVTQADIAANEIVRERLMDGSPGYGWLSEESENDPARLAARRVWVVDPID